MAPVCSSQFISGVMAALSAMVSLEIPQVNIMTKMDLLSNKAKKEIEKWVAASLWLSMISVAYENWGPSLSLIQLNSNLKMVHFLLCYRYLDPDMYSMMEDKALTLRSKKFKKLTEAICGLVGSPLKVWRYLQGCVSILFLLCWNLNVKHREFRDDL